MAILNILYHHRTQGRGAEGTHIISIIRGFEQLGHRVVLVSPPGIDPFKEIGAPPVDKTQVKTRGLQRVWKWVSKHVPNPVFELIEIVYNIPARRRLEQVIRREKFDLIFERYAFYLLAGSQVSRKHGIPLIIEANEVSGIEDRARKQSFEWLCNWFERRLFKQATGIFTVSSFLKKMITDKGTDSNKVHVLPNAIDPASVTLTRDPAQLRASLGLSGKMVIGFAGWFDSWDRLDFLLEVYQTLHRDYPDLAMLLIGDGPALVALKQEVQARQLTDAVVFSGAVPKTDMFSYLSVLDIAVLPHSNKFGSPVILFEMMSLKKPIVAPRLAPIEDVLVDGEHARLFEPLDRAGCVTAIKGFLDSEETRNRCATRSHELLLREHTWVNNSRKILDSLRSANPGRDVST